MFCPKCGLPLAPGARFCPSCGADQTGQKSTLTEVGGEYIKKASTPLLPPSIRWRGRAGKSKSI